MDPIALIAARGGVASFPELTSAGVSRRRLSSLVDAGALRRPRRGWYSTLPTVHPRFRAVRVGGRLTGASALHEMRAWMLDPPRILEVAVPRGSARLRLDAGARVHWVDDRAEPQSGSIVGLVEALVRVVLDHDVEVSAPCIDWALQTGRMTWFEFEQLLLALPADARCIRYWVDRRSQSILESVARVRLLRRGMRLESQVRVADLGSIDLVVGGGVALELDGREFHQKRFEEDRLKDLQITLEGRHAIRVSARMLRRDWPRIERAIALALTARGLPAHNSVVVPPTPRGHRHAPATGRIFD